MAVKPIRTHGTRSSIKSKKPVASKKPVIKSRKVPSIRGHM